MVSNNTLSKHLKILFYILAVFILLTVVSFNQAHAALLFNATPVNDSGNNNSIASGNTTRNLAVGADGSIYAVYRGASVGIRVAKSTDRGANFQPSVQVSTANFEAEIAVSTTGIIYVVWSDGSNAMISRSLDDGTSFSIPIVAGLGSTSIHMATDGSHVYLIDRPGNTILVSVDNGLTFIPTALGASQVFSDIHVDQKTHEVITVLDNPAVKYFTSNDFGSTFSSQIDPVPGGDIFFSVGTVSSGSNGRFMFVSGSDTNALKVNLDTNTSETLVFGNNTSSQGRSLTSDSCGNVIDGFVNSGDVKFRVSNDLGISFGAAQIVAAADAANVFINPTNGDILYLYEISGEVFLSVFDQELGDCYTPTLDTSALVFSALLVGQTSATQEVTITNTGIVDVDITGIMSDSAEFAQTNACIGTLAVGTSCPISVSFTPSATGTRTGELQIQTNVFVDPRVVTLTGEGVSAAPVPRFTPSNLDFGSIPVGNSLVLPITLENIGTADLAVFGFSTASPFNLVNKTCGATLIPAASCTLHISFDPTTIGLFNGGLVLDSNASGAPAEAGLVGEGSPLFTVGGNVSGLSGTGLTLQNNGGDDLAISADGSFTFATALNDLSAYSVSVLTQPGAPSQTCSVSNDSGTIAGANITDVMVTCVTNQFTVGGMVTGLSGSGLVLQNNGGDNLAISADGSFTFATTLDDLSAYAVSVLMQPSNPSQTCSVSNGSGNIAGANVTNVLVNCTIDQFTVSGMVTGLSGTGLVLQNNGGDDLAISADGSFTFATTLDDLSAYVVSVLTQPSNPSQTCSVSNGSGNIAGSNVTDVMVTCVTNQFTIGGMVTGLSGSGLVLQNNGGDDLAISVDGSFTFATALNDLSAYAVSILNQPESPSQTCSVSNGSGNITSANVTNVMVTCATDQFTVGGMVTGLNGSGLVLQNNGGDDLAISADGSFTFATALDDLSAYAVSVLTQPSNPSQTCSISAGSGNITGINVTNVMVTCVTDQFTVGGMVSGLSGNGLVLQNNGGDNLAISADGSFTFTTALDDLSAYAVSIFTQPSNPTQTCSVSSGNGNIASANVTNVMVTCATDQFTVGGMVTGLNGSGLVLQNNGGDDLAISADGSFTFATALDDLSAYAVSVLTQPSNPSQTCSVSNGSGNIAGANVTDVMVNCDTDQFTVGGTVTGLTGSGLVLQNNGGDNLAISTDGSFTFATALDDLSAYSVSVLDQPSNPSQNCRVTNGSGALAGTNLANVLIDCTLNQFTVGGTVNGLQGSGLILKNNDSDHLPINSNGPFTFSTPHDDLSGYFVAVLAHPSSPSQTCSLSNGAGNIAGANVTNIIINCVTDQYTVGGTLTGLNGSNTLTIQNNGGDSLVLSANGNFTFSNLLLDGSSYNVTVSSLPELQLCNISNGSGTLSGTNVENVAIECTTIGLNTTPSKLLFDDLNILGLSDPQTVVVENTGTANLIVTEVGIQGVEHNDYIVSLDDCTNSLLLPGATCNIEVVFSPTDAGIREAELFIKTDLFSRIFIVKLTGTSGVLFFDGLEQ